MRYTRIFFILIIMLACSALNAQHTLRVIPDSDIPHAILFNEWGLKPYVIAQKEPDESGNFIFNKIDTLPSGSYSLRIGSHTVPLILNKEDVLVKAEGGNYYPKSPENDLYLQLFTINRETFKGIDSLKTEYVRTVGPTGMITQNTPDSIRQKAELINEKITERMIAWNRKLEEFGSRHEGTFVGDVMVRFSMVPVEQRDEDDPFYIAGQNVLKPIDFSDPRILRTSEFRNRIGVFINRGIMSGNSGGEADLRPYFLHLRRMTEPFPSVHQPLLAMLIEMFEKIGPESRLIELAEVFDAGCESAEGNLLLLNQKAEQVNALLPGKPAPEVEVHLTGGEKVSLKNFKGKDLLLIFWSSTCPHCKEELPKIARWYREQGDENRVEVLAVSLDRDAKSFTDAVKELDLSWNNACEYKGWETEAARTYMVSRTPMSIWIDPEGIIKKRDLALFEIEKVFKQNNFEK